LNQIWKSIKFQVPNNKQVPINRMQNLKQNRFGHLRIEDWNLFGVWDLGFGLVQMGQDSND
jgi:hypothetical protein